MGLDPLLEKALFGQSSTVDSKTVALEGDDRDSDPNDRRIKDFIERSQQWNDGLQYVERRATFYRRRPTQTQELLEDLNFVLATAQPDLDPKLGVRSRFGDGDGSFWDRWVASTSLGTKLSDGDYCIASMPSKSTQADGSVAPRSGFKRFILDQKLVPPRVMRYDERRRVQKGEFSKTFTFSGKEDEAAVVPEDYATMSATLKFISAPNPASLTASYNSSMGESDVDPFNTVKPSRFAGINTATELTTVTSSMLSPTYRYKEPRPRGHLAISTAMSKSLLADTGDRDSQGLGSSGDGSSKAVLFSTAAPVEAESKSPHFQLALPSTGKRIKRVSTTEKPPLQEGVAYSLTSKSDESPEHGSFKMTSVPLAQPTAEQAYGRVKDQAHLANKTSAAAVMDAIRLEDLPVSEQKYYGPEGKADFFHHYQALRKDRTHFTKQEVENMRPYEFSSPSESLQAPLTSVSHEDVLDETPEQLLEVMQSRHELPLTPRGRFIHGCLQLNLMPRAGLLVRKDLSKTLDLSHQGMGDDTMRVLARSMSELPNLESVNVSDNKLTDASLPLLATAFGLMKKLQRLDISDNVIGQQAARAFFHYFRNQASQLREVHMRHADLEDDECNKFIEAITKHTGVATLDISRNYVGMDEVRSIRDRSFITGGVALANALRDPACKLQKLDVSWNYLRLTSAWALGKALEVNHSLTELDLQYNTIGAHGGEALGYALLCNKTLQRVNLASNQLTATAAFVIAVAIKKNQYLKYLDLSGNPIGVLGGKELLAATSWVECPLTVKLAGCNLTANDDRCWFNPEYPVGNRRLNLTKPYDRAVLESLLMMASRDRCLQLSNIKLTTPDGTVMPMVLERVSPPPPAPHVWGCTREKLLLAFHRALRPGEISLRGKEVIQALESLGLGVSKHIRPVIMDMLIKAYTTQAQSGVEPEQLLQLYGDLQSLLSDQLFEGDTLVLSDTKAPWELPTEGIVNITVSLDRHIPAYQYCLKPMQLTNLKRLVLSVENRFELLTLSLSRMRIQLREAKEIFDLLAREMGDNARVLAEIVPHLATPYTARALINSCLTGNHRNAETRRLMTLMGPAFAPFIGLLSGRYYVDITNKLHFKLIERLLALDRTQIRERRSQGLADISQNGDWTSFRNVRLESEKILLDAASWDRMLANRRSTGKNMRFDYVYTKRPASWERPEMSDCMADFLVEMRIVPVMSRGWFMFTVAMPPPPLTEIDKTMGKRMSMELSRLYGDPIPSPEELARLEAKNAIYDRDDVRTLKTQAGIVDDAPPSRLNTPLMLARSRTPVEGDRKNSAVGLAPESLSQLPGAITQRRASAVIPFPEFNGNKRDSMQGQMSFGDTYNSEMSRTGGSVSSVANARRMTRGLSIKKFGLSGKGLARTGGSLDDRRRSSGKPKFIIRIRGYQILRKFVAKMLHKARLRILLVRGAYDIDMYLSSRYFTCAQTRAFILQLPRGKARRKKEEEGSKSDDSTEQIDRSVLNVRIELLVRMFSRIVDLHNFHMVTALFGPEEHAEIVFRLGLLNVWEPQRPDSWYELNLERREERQLCKCLLALSIVEPGENFVDTTFKITRADELLPGWTLPRDWIHEDRLPKRGFLSLRFYSGEGRGYLGCRPSPLIRTVLRVAVLATPTDEEKSSFPELFKVPMSEWISRYILSKSELSLDFY